MAVILNIETSTTVCSVALSRENELISLEEVNEGFSHAENLSLLIEKVFRSSGMTYHDLDAVAVSKGPGSYTGLRIGVSTAKGLAYSLELPLIAINTLEALSVDTLVVDEAIKVPMLDARRMEVYTAMYNNSGDEIMPVKASIIDAHSFEEETQVLTLFGPGADKCKEVLRERKNIKFIDKVLPSAKSMILLSNKAYQEKRFEDVAYFEPFYLKDFVAGKPKKLL